MRHAILLVALTLPLAGCDFLDRLEGRNPNREYMERLAARNDATPAAAAPVVPVAIAPVAPVELVAVQPVTVPAPAVQPEPTPAVEPEPPTPTVCTPIFRILSCSDDGTEWIWL